MNFQVLSDMAETKAEALILILNDEKELCVSSESWWKDLKPFIGGLNEKKIKRMAVVRNPSGEPAEWILLFHTNLEKYHQLQEKVKIFAAEAVKWAKDNSISKIAFLMNGGNAPKYAGKVIEGATLGSYSFGKYRKPSDDLPQEIDVDIICDKEKSAETAAFADHSRMVSAAVNECRDLVNEPGNAVYPETVAELACKIASENGLESEILDEKELESQGYNAILTVGRGSKRPSRMVILRYKPETKSEYHLAMVGKTVTYDTGGLSLKPSNSMLGMKCDMAGGAAVLYAMKAIAQLKPKIAVTGILVAAENMPSGDAVRPGDIFQAKNGMFIEVDNTDAEGRLCLIDGLMKASEEKATHVVDIATLTGACVVALGENVAAVMTDSSSVAKAIIDAGYREGEDFWELPLVKEYRKFLETPSADIRNTGKMRWGGAITAGMFLKDFVDERLVWAHLDIAGPAFRESGWKYFKKEATGFGVKTLVRLCERFDEYFPAGK